MKSLTTRSVFSLLLLAMTVMGCSKEQGATPIDRSQATLAPNNQWAQSAGITLNGDIRGNSSQDSFQDSVSGFIEGRWAPEVLGYVSSDASGGTGVYLGGRVELQSGILNPSNTTQMNIRADSKMFVAVYDEYTGRPDANGEVVPALSRIFTSATGYVQGNRAYITFSDEYGSVELEGTFNGDIFYGRFDYDNTRRWDGGGQGAAGSIGDFRVPTCQFFRCQ